MRVFHPEVFQGSIKKRNYFEGWYLKHVSQDETSVYSFIPGISTAKNDRHAFIQIINGVTGETQYITYPIEEFEFKTERFWVRVGQSIFGENGIQINIDDPDFQAVGELTYGKLSKYPGSLLAPGIMGWYSYIPFMECYHGIVSANHTLNGVVQMKDDSIDFSGGRGYIEKDWGTSFPECWIWLQSNSFEKEGTSLFVSVAKIPWLGNFFMGFIAFLYHEGKYHIFATYNGSKLDRVDRDSDNIEIELSNSKERLKVKVISKSSGDLIAPTKGHMDRRIKESLDSTVEVSLIQQNKVVFEGNSNRAGLEVIEKIFEYL